MQIYQILNIVTNKSYVGKSKDYLARYKRHLKNAEKKVNRRLYDSMNFHGVEKFQLILLEDIGEVTRKVASDREEFWISSLNTMMPYGYNMTKGGDGGNTLEFWDKDKKRLLHKAQGESRKGERSIEFKQTMSLAATLREGRKTDDQRRIEANKISNTLRRRYALGEIVAKMPTPKYGKNHPGFVVVELPLLLGTIKNGLTLRAISAKLGISSYVIRERLKTTGKTFQEWRIYYGITII